MNENTILEVRELKKYFSVSEGFWKRNEGYVKAVDGINFSIKSGQTFGLVGESGCGKTTTARLVMRALEPTAGQILFRTAGEKVVDMADLNKEEIKPVRQDIQMVFQDPYSSLNPRLPVLEIIAEPLKAFGWEKDAYRERTAELLDLVGLDAKYMSRYPHAFSGGQRQRIGIARALALNPGLVVADEPVSALDVSVQAQILNLLKKLQKKMGLTYLFIAHDLSVIRYICDKVAVMYLGRLVETAVTADLFTAPFHPYTAALLTSVPVADPREKWMTGEIHGEITDFSRDIEGCSFAPRCRYCREKCLEKEPELINIDGHSTACHRHGHLELEGIK
ncbi:MAG: ABC transporter ATP-binding protein [Halanaerobiales bacterium]